MSAGEKTGRGRRRRGGKLPRSYFMVDCAHKIGSVALRITPDGHSYVVVTVASDIVIWSFAACLRFEFLGVQVQCRFHVVGSLHIRIPTK